ncbi:unnamed protein product [Rotaria sordida]|uniref:Uncharacterized protein n=1 Tax=Rotaria sordida TaxID=392033 RepID=A0A815R1G3_9BILA|nr:unnamed protein product [Rotaria sordida]CAF1470582.1 unnamed protein product [Rotaria sordida]
MVADTSLYDVLEVKPDATKEQITAAIKKKSLEHHPDRGGSHEMMQKVNAAKEILTDPQKRHTYDRYGLKGIRSDMAESDSAFSGVSSIFDIFDLITGGRSRGERSTPPKGSDIKQALKVSLEELYLGTTKTVTVNRKIICADCHGVGSQDGTTHECTNCEGTGIETIIHRMGPFIQQMQSKCSSCDGDGRTIDWRNRCKKCNGQKLFQETKKLDVHITHGSQDRETIKLSGQGNQIPNGESGNVYIILDQQPHAIFNRNGDNLIMKLEINLTESLCGFQRLINLLDGHTILIKHPAGKPIIPNTYRCLKGYGMPNRHTHSHGDLIIHFDVKFPEENFITTDSQRQQLEALLPSKTPIRLNKKKHYEEAEMKEYEFSGENVHKQHFSNGHHHETAEDDDTHFHESTDSIPWEHIKSMTDFFI